MKIDLSTIFMVIAFFIPGLVFRTSRNRVVPRSLLAKGTTEEVAELAGFALVVHAFLFLLVCAYIALLRSSSWHEFSAATVPRIEACFLEAPVKTSLWAVSISFSASSSLISAAFFSAVFS